MSNSTPQGPGPQYGSNPDATPIDETEAVEEAMGEEVAELKAEGADDGAIDISEASGPEISGGDDVS